MQKRYSKVSDEWFYYFITAILFSFILHILQSNHKICEVLWDFFQHVETKAKHGNVAALSNDPFWIVFISIPTSVCFYSLSYSSGFSVLRG